MSDLIKGLRGGREAVARGTLTFDEEKARQKLRDFRLPDPHYYVLQLVRTASALGAREIDFDIGPRGIVCSFGAELPADLLDSLWSQPFSDRSTSAEQAAHYLALGLGSAAALRPKFVSIASGLQYREVVYDDRDVRFAELDDPTAQFLGRTRIELREYFRFEHVREWLIARAELPEARVLREFCRHAAMEVRVNETPVSIGLDSLYQYVGSEEMDEAAATVGLDQVSLDSHVELLKHDVRVEWLKLPYHGLAGRGFLRMNNVATDLSGMRAVRDESLKGSLERVVWSAYHRALSDWVGSAKHLDDSPALVVMEHLFPNVQSSFHRTDVAGPGSVELVEHLLQQPAFIPATGEGRDWVSLAEVLASKNNRQGIAWSRVAFRDLPSREPPVVLLSQHVAPNTRTVLRAASRYFDVPMWDVTDELQDERAFRDNQNIWESRSPREAVEYPIMRRFEVDGAEGYVFVAMNEHGRVLPEEAGVRVYRDGRLVAHRDLAFPDERMFDPAQSLIGVVIDGSFEPDRRFESVIPDERYEALARKTMEAVPSVMRELAEFIIEREGRVHREVSRAIDLFLRELSRLTFPTFFLQAMGLSPVKTTQLVEQANVFQVKFVSGEGSWSDGGKLRGQTMYSFGVLLGMDGVDALDALGPLADVQTYEVFDSKSPGRQPRKCSLREISGGGRHLVLDRRGDWFELVDRAAERIPDHDPVLVVDEVQRDVLDLVVSDFGDARLLLEVAFAEAEFLAREPFEIPGYDRASIEGNVINGGQTLQRVRRDLYDGEIQVDLHGHVHPGCEVYFVHRGRLLERVRFDLALGRFSAYVQSDAIVPDADWAGAVRNASYEAVMEEVRYSCALAVHQWWREVLETGVPEDGGLRALHMRVTAARVKNGNDRQERAIPVLVDENRTWKPALWSFEELDEARKRGGDLLAYTSGDLADRSVLPFEGAPVVAVGGGAGSEALGRMFPETRLVDASYSAAAAPLDARRRFQRRQWVSFDLNGTGVLNANQFHGVFVKTLLVPDATYGTGKPRVQATVLYEDRALETLDVPVPFGRFRAIAHGSPIGPDPMYEFVARGRPELLAAIHRAAAATIEFACEQQNRLQSGQVHWMVEAVREDLIRMIEQSAEAREPGWDHLHDLLRNTRLFKTTRGRWLAWDELGSLARGDVIPYSRQVHPVEGLKILDKDLPWYRRLLHPWVLRSVETLDFLDDVATNREPPVQEERESSPVVEASYPLAEAVRERIEQARGTRLDLIGDAVLKSIAVVDGDGASLCEVTSDRVAIDRNHPLVRRAEERMDDATIAFVTSVVCTSINRHYVQITDSHESELQQLFLRSRRPNVE